MYEIFHAYNDATNLWLSFWFPKIFSLEKCNTARLPCLEWIRGACVCKLGWVRIPYGPMLSCNSSFVWIYAWSRVIESNLAKDSMEPFYPIVHSCVPNKLCSVVAYFLVFIHKAQLETWECSWLASRVFSPPHRFNELPLLCEASFLILSARNQRTNQVQLFKTC